MTDTHSRILKNSNKKYVTFASSQHVVIFLHTLNKYMNQFYTIWFLAHEHFEIKK